MRSETLDVLRTTSEIDPRYHDPMAYLEGEKKWVVVEDGMHPDEDTGEAGLAICDSFTDDQIRENGLLVVTAANANAKNRLLGPVRSLSGTQMMAFFNPRRKPPQGSSGNEWRGARHLLRFYKELNPDLIAAYHGSFLGNYSVAGKECTPHALGAAVILAEQCGDLGFNTCTLVDSPYQKALPQALIIEKGTPQDGESREPIDARINDCVKYIIGLGSAAVAARARDVEEVGLRFVHRVAELLLDPQEKKLYRAVARTLPLFLALDEPTGGPNAALETPVTLDPEILSAFRLSPHADYFFTYKVNRTRLLTPQEQANAYTVWRESAHFPDRSPKNKWEGLGSIQLGPGALFTSCGPPTLIDKSGRQLVSVD